MLRAENDSSTWPKPGEVWAPCAPWPRSECPGNFYVHATFHGDSRRDEQGFTFAVFGATESRFCVPPVSREAAVSSAWEWRYGSAEILTSPEGYFEESSGDWSEPGRCGSGPLTIEVVGAQLVWARRPDGAAVTIWARDMRLGWCRVEAVP